MFFFWGGVSTAKLGLLLVARPVAPCYLLESPGPWLGRCTCKCVTTLHIGAYTPTWVKPCYTHARVAVTMAWARGCPCGRQLVSAPKASAFVRHLGYGSVTLSINVCGRLRAMSCQRGFAGHGATTHDCNLLHWHRTQKSQAMFISHCETRTCHTAIVASPLA